MKKYLKFYINFIYDYYIIDNDFEIYTKFGKIFIYPFWLCRCIFAILYSISCFPLVLFYMGYLRMEIYYEEYKEQIRIDELTDHIRKLNKK